MKRISILSILIFCTALCIAQPELDFQQEVLTGPAFSNPVSIAAPGDGSGRLYIVEKRGTVRTVKNDTVRTQFFIDVQPLGIYNSASECGLLGMCFHPNFPTTPYVYVYYIKPDTSSQVSRFTYNPTSPYNIDEGTEFVILNVPQPPYTNHKAGDIQFGPDGYLYITLGDGGSGGDPHDYGQNGQSLLGKILRIDVDNGDPYSIPPDNPFVNNSNVRDEIWAMGMRNPWRLSFDRETGDLWIGDVGQITWEEINFEPAGDGGKNYGWDCYEGNASYEGAGCTGMSDYDFPIFVYPHNCSQGPCDYGTGNCVIGGFVYRGQDFNSMKGYYICADNGSENIWIISHDAGGTDITMQPGSSMFSSLKAFGEDDEGELWAVASNFLYRVVPDGFLPIYLTHFEAFSRVATVDLHWQFENMTDVKEFIIERSVNGLYFSSIGTVKADADKLDYVFTDLAPANAINYYRLVYTLLDGSAKISEVRSVDRSKNVIWTEAYTHVGGGLVVTLSDDVETADVSLLAVDGRLIANHHIATSYNEIPGTESLQNGVYLVVVKSGERKWVHKWFKD